jgi:HD-GYP domain-containing protein (c-di-GMP phosphodiesterase class II)
MTLHVINFFQLANGLSNIIDLVGVDDVHHGKRVAYMCVETGKQLGLEADLLQLLFYAGQLHDCGVSSTDVHKQLINEMDWEGAQAHCQRGYELLKGQTLFKPLAPILLYHHTRWREMQGDGVPEQTALLSNLVYLADRADALLLNGGYNPFVMGREAITLKVQHYQSEYFAPELANAFVRVSQADAFWHSLHPGHIEHYITDFPRQALMPGVPPETRCENCLLEVAYLIADIVDAKSPYTAEHSRGVANLSRHLGELNGLDEHTCDLLEIAGLLHDIGKLRVPDTILAKPKPLSSYEGAIMSGHAFETYQILRPMRGFEQISEWAGFHHEKLDGSGYPFGLTAEQLSLEARIVAVADVFHALAQSRPYKAPASAEAVLAGLQARAREGKIDAGLVQMIQDDLEVCWNVACGLG